MIAFFDASALIYLIEEAGPFASQPRAELERLAQQHRTVGAAVSRLSWLKCRVRPAREEDLETLAAFDAFFARPDLVWVELSREVVELATAIRVKHGLRTPAALQAASCLQLGSQHMFITGDSAFRKITGLRVKVLR
ncbi:MAG TPA: type II toxin-antitoxin system VapC family toxin [Steroidobacteraceae bacterium]|nr:type II toxin-antitoxin system VapC family toxin [Steroidobacteraceae bacterium]